MIQIEWKYGLPEEAPFSTLWKTRAYSNREFQKMSDLCHEVRSISAHGKALNYINTNFLNIPRPSINVSVQVWFGNIAQTILGNILEWHLAGDSSFFELTNYSS